MRWLRFCGRAAFFWIASALTSSRPRGPQPHESPHRRWVRTIGTCSITFSAWRKEFARARSTTISGVETRRWRARCTCARLVTEGLIDELGGLSPNILQRECAVTYSVGYGESESEARPSNLAREVMFCVGHAIHHYALLRLLCAGAGVKLPFEFGIAPSTLKHLEAKGRSEASRHAFLALLPETQAALTLSIFLATFVYEDGATLLAATASASGALDPRVGLLTTFLGIWVGDMGLYGLGSSFGRRTARSRWLRKHLKPESLAKAEGWFARHGSFALVMSRAIPGSRLPLYLAAGALRLPVRLFAKTTALCSAVWVAMIFAIWRFIPKRRRTIGGGCPGS